MALTLTAGGGEPEVVGLALGTGALRDARFTVTLTATDVTRDVVGTGQVAETWLTP